MWCNVCAVLAALTLVHLPGQGLGVRDVPATCSIYMLSPLAPKPFSSRPYKPEHADPLVVPPAPGHKVTTEGGAQAQVEVRGTFAGTTVPVDPLRVAHPLETSN